MASDTTCLVSKDEFFLFHRIDREVYKTLVINLVRDPWESMQIVALWLWLERVWLCKCNLVSKISCLPNTTLINQIADEAVECLNCIYNNISSSSVPLLQSLMMEKKKEMCVLRFLREKRDKAIEGVGKIVEEVCVRAFSDIIVIDHEKVNIDDGRSMFVTFSKGYPVSEWELREYIRSKYGDCIEGLYMQEVHQPNEQPLFARIVFNLPSTIDFILNGATKTKFTINGKHVCARKFVPKRPTITLPLGSL